MYTYTTHSKSFLSDCLQSEDCCCCCCCCYCYYCCCCCYYYYYYYYHHSQIITTTTFMQGIYNHILETNHVSRACSVAAVLYSQSVLHVTLFYTWESGNFPHRVFVFQVFRSSCFIVTSPSMLLIKLIKKSKHNFINNLSSTFFSFVRHLQAEYTIVVWTIHYNAINGFDEILSHIIMECYKNKH